MNTLPCIWCDQTFTNKIALANHFDNEHKGSQVNTEEPTKALRDEFVAYFEANYLDGDKVQAGQMIASTEILHYIDTFVVPRVERHVQAARIDENQRYHLMLLTGKWRSFGTEVTERLAELQAATAKPTESKPATDHTYDGTAGPMYRNGD